VFEKGPDKSDALWISERLNHRAIRRRQYVGEIFQNRRIADLSGGLTKPMTTNLPRVGSAVVVCHDDRLLLARRAKDPNRGKWIFPGGKIEPFESIREAAARELLEETGLEIEVTGQIGAFEIIRPPSEHRLIVFNWAEPVGGKLRPASDVSELRFCTRQELAQLDLSEIVAHVARTIGWLGERTALAA
jgi:ADP-ribose pyrophosphatase YjhB (NUDIX family)